MPEISIVIPTYNRCETLLMCLDALKHQTIAPSRYEIIVVDDGSRDQTAAMMHDYQGVRFFQQPRNAGPAAARNVGVKAAVGRLILFLGDDIMAPPRLLEQHLEAHQLYPGEHIAILGYAPWGDDEEVTPLMRYLVDGYGVTFQQFSYHAIADPDHVSYGFFYTCNISISRDFMLRHGLFDEEFRHAYGEDTELAYRLARHGLWIVFRREITADHYHPTPYRSARQRARRAGEIAVMMARKHPELADLRFVRRDLKARAVAAAKRWLTEHVADRLLELADRRRWDHPLLPRAYDWALREHQHIGLLDAIAAGTPPQASEAVPAPKEMLPH